MPQIEEHAMSIPEAEERQRTFILATVQDGMEILCFFAGPYGGGGGGDYEPTPLQTTRYNISGGGGKDQD